MEVEQREKELAQEPIELEAGAICSNGEYVSDKEQIQNDKFLYLSVAHM